MQNDDLRSRCAAEAARLSAETFVWDREAEKYVAAYELVLAPRAVRSTSAAGSKTA